MKRILVILMLSCLQQFLYGQNFNYSILESSPLQMNPALAGNVITSNRNHIPAKNRTSERLCAVYQNSKTIHEKASFFSYDARLGKIGAGIGAIMEYQRIGNGLLSNYALKVIYNSQHWIGFKTRISMAIQPGLEHKTFDRSHIRFSDVEKPFTSFNPVYYDSLPFRGESYPSYKSYFTLGAGLVLTNPVYQIGLSFQNINQPNWAISRDTRQIKPIQYTLHGKLRLMQLSKDQVSGENNRIDLQTLYTVQNGGKIFIGGLLARYYAFIGGLSYSYKDVYGFKGQSAICQLGFLTGSLHLLYGAEVLKANSSGQVSVQHSFSIILNTFKMTNTFTPNF